MKSGQTIVEYTFLIGIVIAIVVAMSPMVKRSSQAMVKVVADEVGLQRESEQGMIYSTANRERVLTRRDEGARFSLTNTTFTRASTRSEWQLNQNSPDHSIRTDYQEQTRTDTSSASDLGFTPKND